MKVDKVDTLKGNKMIAEFMGYKYYQNPNIDCGWRKESGHLKIQGYYLCRTTNKMRYHSSWDWLMPVVVKIESYQALNRFDIYYKNCNIEYRDDDNSFEFDGGIQGDTKIEAVWNAIVYFIDWVNENDIDLENPVFYD